MPPDSDENSDNNNNPRDENKSDEDDDDDSITPLLVDRSNSMGENLADDGADEEDVDPDVLADVDPAVVEREAKILRAAKHVVMARAQRKLFQQAMRRARENSAASKDTNDALQ